MPTLEAHSTLSGLAVPIPPEQQGIAAAIHEAYRREPDVESLAGTLHKILREHDMSIRGRRARRLQPLEVIAQDLLRRRKVIAEEAPFPDLREGLREAVSFNYDSTHQFSKAVGISEAHLSRVFRDDQDRGVSLGALLKIAATLGRRVQLVDINEDSETRALQSVIRGINAECMELSNFEEYMGRSPADSRARRLRKKLGLFSGPFHEVWSEVAKHPDHKQDGCVVGAVTMVREQREAELSTLRQILARRMEG